MVLAIAQFISLLLMGLGIGVALSHALQWSRKATLSGEAFLRVQQTLYTHYGPAGGIIETGTLLSTLVVLFLVPGRGIVFVLTLIALVCTIATTVVWAAFINPINRQVSTWTAETLPPNWTQFGRDRWHALHALRLMLLAIGTSTLIISLLVAAVR